MFPLTSLERRMPLLIILVSAIYSAVFSFYSFTNHFSFRTYACDLGIFNQALYSSLNYGLMFFDTIELGTHFQFHFDPILFLLLPLYSFAPTPLLLLAIQSAALGFAAIPAFLLSRDVLKSSSLAFILSLCYLANPSIHGVNLYDFHPDCFFPLLFLSSLLFLERGRLLKSAFCMVLALMCKETAAFVVVAIGVYVAWAYRKELPWRLLIRLRLREAFSSRYPAFTLSTIVLGVTWFILSSVLFPSIVSANRHAFSWSYLGAGVGGALISLLMNPVGSLQAAFTPSPAKLTLLKMLYGNYLSDQALLILALAEPWMKANYLFCLFFPFAFLPLLSPAALLPVAPWLLVSITSITPTHYVAVGYQYPAVAVPFMFVASVHGVRNAVNLYRKSALNVKVAPRLMGVASGKRAPLLLVLLVLSCSLAGVYAWSPIWLVESPTPRDQFIRIVASSVPPCFTVATQNDLFPHLTPTMNLYLGHYTFMPPSTYDIIIADTYSPWYYLSGSSGLRLLYDLLPLNELVEKLLASGNYTIIFQFDGIMVVGRLS